MVVLLDVIKKASDANKIFEEIENNIYECSKIIDTIKSRNNQETGRNWQLTVPTVKHQLPNAISGKEGGALFFSIKNVQ
jgi:hypothetical protein